LFGTSFLERAGRWFLDSGIQEPSGGVARFYLADIGKNKAVSTEITGYVASALMFLYETTKRQEYLDRARLTASFLCEHAWDADLGLFPYEHPSPSDESDHLGYFFDTGIIIRGLLAVWRVTRQDELLGRASEAARSMLSIFRSVDGYHPILALPDKEPLPRENHWSRSIGCYQTKSALAWWEVSEITGDKAMRDAYLETVYEAIDTHRSFLPGTDERLRVMDRLHAYSYFLEALSPLLDRQECVEAYRAALANVSCYLRDIRPAFVRSDVYAQLLRARVYGAKVIPVDRELACDEASALAAFQAVSEDPRVDGGFYFGKRAGEIMPHANPVSTAFAIQAMEVWRTSTPILPPI
jgi:uncharacterized protein YyaL (SSP411 family)